MKKIVLVVLALVVMIMPVNAFVKCNVGLINPEKVFDIHKKEKDFSFEIIPQTVCFEYDENYNIIERIYLDMPIEISVEEQSYSKKPIGNIIYNQFPELPTFSNMPVTIDLEGISVGTHELYYCARTMAIPGSGISIRTGVCGTVIINR